MTAKRLVDTAWLEDFLALIEEKGFARAASRRNVTQPAFSRRIQSLEQWLDAPLFDRSTHTIQLTPAGESFQAVARAVLNQLASGRDLAQQAMRNRERELSFVVTQALAMTFFPAWLRSIEALAPLGAIIKLTAGHMVECERIMQEGKAQFLLCHQRGASASWLEGAQYDSISVGTDQLLPVCAPARPGSTEPLYLLTGGKSSVPYLSYTEQSGMGRILSAAWQQNGTPAQLDSVFASHVSTVLIALARDGRGVTWAPRSLVDEDLRGGRLVRAGPDAMNVELDIRLFRPHAAQHPLAEELWNRARQLPRAVPG
jgi:DNA-binding transcriptional LysR family regulator